MSVVMGIIKIIIMVIVTVIMVIAYRKKRYMVILETLTSSRWFKKCSLSTAMFRLPNSLVKSFWFKTESCIICICVTLPPIVSTAPIN